MFIASLIILQLIIFGILIFIFRRIMAQNVVFATRHLDELSQDYDAKAKKINRDLDEAKVKAQELIGNAQEEAEKLKLEIIKHAETERDTIVSQARLRAEEIMQQADKSRQQLLLELEQRIAKGAVQKACELIQDTLPVEFKQLVHARWVEDLIESGFAQLERLRIPEGAQEITIISAFALSDEQRKRLSRKLKDSLGHEAAFKEEVDPRVVAGLVINIGSLVLDGSLRNKIQEKTR